MISPVGNLQFSAVPTFLTHVVDSQLKDKNRGLATALALGSKRSGLGLDALTSSH